MTNHYETLGVKRKASRQQIKDAYRMLSKELHPDKHNGNVEKFKELASAYEVLSDPERKAFYDRTGSDITENEYDRKAGALLQQIFQAIVTKNGLEKIVTMDMIAVINGNLDTGMVGLDKKIDTARESRAAIGKILKRVKHKNKMNPISAMLKHEIQQHTETIMKLKHEKIVGERARNMLKEYGFEFDTDARTNSSVDQWASTHRYVTFTGTS